MDRAVTQTLGVIACHDPLHCGKEMLDEDLLLVVEILADALGHRDGGTLQFQDGERYAIDIKHYIRALGMGLVASGRNSHLLGYGEMVVLWFFPIDEPDIHRVLARARLHFHGIAQHVINSAIAVVDTFAGVSRRLFEKVERPLNQLLIVTLLVAKKGSQIFLFNVAVAFAVGPVAEVVIVELLTEQLHHALLRLLLDLADHAQTNLVLPVSSSCIMPCFRAQVL